MGVIKEVQSIDRDESHAQVLCFVSLSVLIALTSGTDTEVVLCTGADPKVPFPYGGVTNYSVLHFEAYDGNR